MSVAENYYSDSVDIVIDSIDTRPFRRGFVVHSFESTVSHMSEALEFARKRGDKFWGIERTGESGPIPQTLVQKMNLLRETVQLIPNLEEYAPMAHDWVTAPDTVDVKKLQSRKVGVALPHDLQRLFKKAPQTALEVYRTPSVRELAHEALTQIGDPVTNVIDIYEQQFDEYEQLMQDKMAKTQDVSMEKEMKELEHSANLGKVALEQIAFGAGGQPFVELLGSANLEFHTSEVRRRNLQ